MVKRKTKCSAQLGDEKFKRKREAEGRAEILRSSIRKAKEVGDPINLKIRVIKCPGRFIVRSSTLKR